MARATVASKRSSTSSSEEAIIGAGARVRGRVSGDGNLRVEGAIAGDVTLRGDLTVGADAEITATEVQAAGVSIEGAVEADIVATEAVTIGARARVAGTIRGSSISIDEGAQVAARLEADFELPPELTGKAGR